MQLLRQKSRSSHSRMRNTNGIQWGKNKGLVKKRTLVGIAIAMQELFHHYSSIQCLRLSVSECVRAAVCARARVCACVRACVSVCVRVCARDVGKGKGRIR